MGRIVTDRILVGQRYNASAMAGTTEEDTSGLKDVGAFLKAMGSRYGRIPALKRFGRLIGQWFLGGLAFVAVCIGAEVVGIGFRKAAETYWRWWVYPPFAIAFVPIGFTLFLAIVQLAAYTVIFPFVLIGQLFGYDRSTASKRIANGLLYLGFGLFVAVIAHESARRSVTPNPPKKAVATATPPACQQQPTGTSSNPSPWSNWRVAAIALISFCGGIAKTTITNVTSKLAERVFDERKRVVIYGPNDGPK